MRGTDGANSAYPGNTTEQDIHRDCPGNLPSPDACPGLVVNVPLQDFTMSNGATRVFLGTHLLRGLPPDVAALGTEARTIVCKGDLILRDLRLCHGGMPNESSQIRTMLAMVHTAATYRGADETQFKGFEAEAGSDEFWQHKRLRTSVAFVPGSMTHRKPGHSSPQTALGDEYKARQQAIAEAMLYDADVQAWTKELRGAEAAVAVQWFDQHFDGNEPFRRKIATLMATNVGGVVELLQAARDHAASKRCVGSSKL